MFSVCEIFFLYCLLCLLFKEPVHIRSRELLTVKAHLLCKKEDLKREHEAKNARSNLASPPHLASPVAV